MAGKAAPRMRTAEEKLEIVQALRNRGSRGVREIAAEYGCSPQLIYNWEKRLNAGEDLHTGAEGDGEEPPQDVAAEMARIREQGAVAMSFDEVPHHHQLELALEHESVSAIVEELHELRVELALLRADNRRLRNALSALAAPATEG